jgi:hypothetical protein
MQFQRISRTYRDIGTQVLVVYFWPLATSGGIVARRPVIDEKGSMTVHSIVEFIFSQ